ncbi:Aspartokinase [Musa troglodytarum]|uniref:aspartate kinase n=1 Tax=Musa troglodytarum TaxID=320322 RepID=A0A9E7L6T8_9LILI|nr:Aspartokinase [Musa troglodytarum]
MSGLCRARVALADQVATRRATVRIPREDLISTVASVRDSFPKGGMLLHIRPPPPLEPISLSRSLCRSRRHSPPLHYDRVVLDDLEIVVALARSLACFSPSRDSREIVALRFCLWIMAAALRFAGLSPCVGFRRDPSTYLPLSWSFSSKLWVELSPRSIGTKRARGYPRSRSLRVSCERGVSAFFEEDEAERQGADGDAAQLSIVMKFGGSSVASAERMKEVADLILNFPEERPVIVLSAMGKTTNNLLLAGEKAVCCGVSNVSELHELSSIKDLHLKTVDELGLDKSIVSGEFILFLGPLQPFGLLDELEQLLKGIAMMKELTLRTRDYLVSFGECMSTRIFAAYLNKIDDFTNADILEATYPAIAKRLHGDWINNPAIPIVTGFLGKGWKSCAVTTLGRGGSDLTATTIGKALGLREIQVWKDVDGVLTCDPNIYPSARPVPHLTFEEAAELAYFGAQVLHPLSMRPAREGDIPVRVKNSYNPQAPGTVITKERDMSKAVLTSIVLKSNITMLDIVSTRMLGQYGFLAKVFAIFEDLGISVDCVATSEELDHVVEELEKIAVVHLLQHRSIISLVGNVQRSSLILEKAFNVLRRNGVNVQMISQGASKVNISLIVNDDEAKQCVKALHSAFFENGFLSEVGEAEFPGNGTTTPSNFAVM